MAIPRTLVLSRSARTIDELARLSETLPWARGRGLAFEIVTGDVQQEVSARRERERDGPIGFVAADESSVLAALSGGADEAMVLGGNDASAFAAFVDRVDLRARRRGEIARLHAAFAHAEKLTALGTLVAGVGHEINNPLSAVMLSIDAARSQLLPALDASRDVLEVFESGAIPDPALLSRLGTALRAERAGRSGSDLLDDMSSAASAIASIVRDLRVFARTDDDELPELVDACELIDHILRLLGREVFKHGLIERDYAADLPRLVVPRNRVTQVVMNVLINATHAIAEVQRPDHRVRVSVRADEDFMAIAVSDTGPGIPIESLERIFDPFFTTKREDLGTGLGLSISRSILRKLGGDLSVESIHGEGATFICFLPLPTREMIRDAFRQRAAGSFTVPRHVGASVLVVDDDPRMLRSYARLLNAEHRIVIAHDGRDAIDMLESGSVANLAVVELDLPGNDGPELLNWLSENRPELARRTLLVTSADSEPNYADFLRGHRGPLLRKPIRGETLLSAIATMLNEERGL
ncbi:MAG TPA: ATP-binding protein [Polyangiaceae bacterium]|jgi:signal transduction histidine kinase|nr:ATP-binding protein [Polyangiaceae bacterium]